MRSKGIKIATRQPQVNCTVFEDKAGAVQLATTDKMRPRTKNMATKLHHFCQYVADGTIAIQYCQTEVQRADMLTKPLQQDLLERFCLMVQGW